MVSLVIGTVYDRCSALSYGCRPRTYNPSLALEYDRVHLVAVRGRLDGDVTRGDSALIRQSTCPPVSSPIRFAKVGRGRNVSWASLYRGEERWIWP